MKAKSRIIILLLLVVALGIGSYFAFFQNKPKEEVKIGLAQIVEHPSLDTIRDAFLERMIELGYKNGEGTKFLIDNAHGEINQLGPIIEKYNSQDVNVIVPIATPTAMAAAKYANRIPVVFSAVSDPIGAKLTDSLEHPDKNITGTSDVIQIEEILNLALELFPNTKTIGCIYNPSEANSVSNMEKVKSFAQKNNLIIKEVGVANTSELAQGTQSLLKDCDILFSPNDNTVASGISTVSDLAIKAKKPFFVGADSMVEDNGFATVGINYQELGRKTADMVKEVLEGKPVKDIPIVEFKDNLNIYINTGVAEKIGYTIPKEISSKENFKAIKFNQGK